MRQLKALGLVGVLVLAGSLSVRADVWDLGAANDDVPTETRNHLIHGSEQIHDLAAKGTPAVADEDWFVLTDEAYSSYVVVIDGLTADVDPAGIVTRRAFDDPNSILQTAVVFAPGGPNVHMGWQNTGAASRSLLRIGPPGVGCTTCDANDQYRIRFFDTTYLIPRFNNANGQVTVLLAQNGLSTGVPWTANYWNAAGQLVAQVPGTLLGHQSAVINTSTIPSLQNQTGVITITHTAGFGGMAVKSVALEPATGFSFDTLGTYRSR